MAYFKLIQSLLEVIFFSDDHCKMKVVSIAMKDLSLSIVLLAAGG
jgi:hypothetical protein